MSIIQSKITSGTCKLYLDFRNGATSDLSGNSNTGVVNGNPVFNRDGLNLDGTGDYLNCGDPAELDFGTGDFTVCYGIKTNTASAIDVISKRNGTTNVIGFNVGIDTGKPYFEIDDGAGNEVNGSGDTVNINDGNIHWITIAFDRSGDSTIYVDGVADGTDTISSVGTIDNVIDFLIGRNGDTSREYFGSILGLVAFNELLTATEVSQLTGELSTKTFTQKVVNKVQSDKLIDDRETGLVGAWDMNPLGQTVVDLTGNGKHGTINGSVTQQDSIFGHTLLFDGTTGYIAIGNTGQTVQTVAFWVNTFSTTEDFIDLDGGTHTIEVAAGTVTATGFDTPIIYIDNTAAATDFTSSNWHRVVVTTATGFTASNLNIGKETIYLDGSLSGLELYSDEKDATWVTADYLKGAELLQFKTDWGAYATEQNVTAGYIGNTPWKRSTGTWKVSTDTINGHVCKVLENVAAGVAYTKIKDLFMGSSDAAFGTWEFWLYKGGNANATFLQFMADEIGTITATGQDGYNLKIDANEALLLQESTNASSAALCNTANAYVTHSTWYGFKITRRYDGQFTIYIKGGSFGEEWTLVSVAGGTNPTTDITTTSSTYIVFDFDAGDKLAISDNNGGHSFLKTVGVY